MVDSKLTEDSAAADVTGGFSYLQLYWACQSLLYLSLILYTQATGSDKSHSVRTSAEQIGWIEFRKRRTTVSLTAVVWLLYMSYKTVGSYCFAVEQSELVRDIGLSVLQPRVVNTDSTSTLVALFLLLVHCMRRLYENLRVSIGSRSQVQGPLSLVLDHVFPVAAGVSLIAESPLLELQTEGCLSLSGLRWYHLVALALYLGASRVQWNTQHQLARMRRNKSGHIVTTQYKQPKDGWFESLNVSNPQYLAEIVVYLSVGLAMGCNSLTWSLLTLQLTLHHIYVALRAHRFYNLKFDDYPKHRKIILPFLL